LAFERLLALHGVFGYAAWPGEDPLGETLGGFILARDLGGEAEILTLGVLPEMRRRGLGRALLDAIMVEAGQRRIASVVLEVATDNEAARRLYVAMGFVRVGTRPRYYRRDHAAVDALILRLPTEAYRGCARPGGPTG
jgi:ribosomal-protein-alanine N-acetyltransferase